MEQIVLTKEKVIIASIAKTTELLEPFMRGVDPDITQQQIDKLMNMMVLRPDRMEHAKRTAMFYFWDKFQIVATWSREGTLKRLM